MNNLEYYYQASPELDTFIDSMKLNQRLSDIFKGKGDLITLDSELGSFTELFVSDLRDYKSKCCSLTVVEQDLFFKSLDNYISFLRSNFSDIQCFEAILIGLLKLARLLPAAKSIHALFISKLFNEHVKLFETTYLQYRIQNLNKPEGK